MRVLATALCWILVFSASPLRAEPARRFDSIGLAAEEPAAPSRLERPWLRSPFGVRLATDVGDPALDVDARIAELTARRDEIKNGWPRAGVISGGILLGAGWLSLAATFSYHDSDNDSGWYAAGGALAAAGLILIGTGVTFLVQHHRQRNAIQREILDLERSRQARSAPSWQLVLAGVEWRRPATAAD